MVYIKSEEFVAEMLDSLVQEVFHLNANFCVLSVHFCDVRSTIFTRGFFDAAQTRLFNIGFITEQSDTNLRREAV